MKHIEVFTDGSSSNNGSESSLGGIGIHFPNGELNDISDPFVLKPVTNQRAELYAIYTALDKITNELKFNVITVYTDSEYSIKSLTKWIHNWKKNDWKNAHKKAIKNRDIIEPTHAILEKYPNQINFIHVKAHTGKKDIKSIGNAEADKLATEGANKTKVVIGYGGATNATKKKNAQNKINIITNVNVNTPPSSTDSYSPEIIKKIKIKKINNKKKKKIIRIKTD